VLRGAFSSTTAESSAAPIPLCLHRVPALAILMWMAEDDLTPGTVRTQALIALARIEPDDDPSTWPTDELGRQGTAAAALVTGHLDALPTDGVGAAWQAMPSALRALIRYRNPAAAVYAAHAASDGSG
jgi:hypothetical protein